MFPRLLPLLAAIVLTGAGCISVKSSKNDTATLGVWKSVDGGANWAKASVVPTASGIGSFSKVAVSELVQDPSDQFAWYVGTDASGMLMSLDGAASWQQPREPYVTSGRVRSIAVDPKTPCTVYASRANRIVKSVNCLRSFDTESYVDARSSAIITDIEVDGYNPSTVYASTNEGDVLTSHDAGATWSVVLKAAGDVRDILIDKSDSRIVLVAYARSGLYRSADAGATWAQVFEKVKTLPKDVRRMQQLGQDASGSHVWAITTGGLIHSTDHGVTWEAIQTLPTGEVAITALAVDPRDGTHVYMAAGGALYETLDGGAAWNAEKLPSALPVIQLAFDAFNSKTLYLGFGQVEKTERLF
jgi:photosystem II stability/assembly factor-like uncharacterized protein